jgi:hypothetical protein
VAAWPAIALVGSYELFMTIIRGDRRPDSGVPGADHVSEADPLRVQAAEVFAADVAAGRLPSIAGSPPAGSRMVVSLDAAPPSTGARSSAMPSRICALITVKSASVTGTDPLRALIGAASVR